MPVGIGHDDDLHRFYNRRKMGTTLRVQGGDVGAVLDEVSDCVLASLSFPAERVSFAVVDACFVDAGE